MTDRVHQKFERAAATYATRYERPVTIFDGEKIRRMELLLEYAKTLCPQSALDLGCGAGTVCAALSAELPASRIVGLDLSYAMLRVACNSRRRHEMYLQSTVERLPLPDNSFDLIFALGVTDYLENLPDFFENVRRVLTPHGHFLFTFPNGDSAFRAIRRAHHRVRLALKKCVGPLARTKPPLAVSPRPSAVIDELIHDCGFAVLHRHYITYGNGFVSLPWSLQASRKKEAWLRDSLLRRYLAWSGVYVVQKTAIRSPATNIRRIQNQADLVDATG